MNLRGQIITGRYYDISTNELYNRTITGEAFDLLSYSFTFWRKIKGADQVFVCSSEFYVVAETDIFGNNPTTLKSITFHLDMLRALNFLLDLILR